MSPVSPASGSLGSGGVKETAMVSPGAYTVLFVVGVPATVFGALFFLTAEE
jgi:hypothetical protein